jgi:Ecdysteroid kinase-like family
MVAAGSDDLTSEALTKRLRASGTLPAGRVIAVHPGQKRTTLVSTIASLRLEYSEDAPREAPTRVLLKGSVTGLDPILQNAGEQEASFYRQAAPLMPPGLLPQCYDVEATDAGVRLLLEDLSDTHMVVTPWPLPPSVEVCERIVDTWAAFHAFWWQHPRLGREVGIFLDDKALAAIGVERRARYPRFAEALGDRLGPAARDLYDRLLDTLDRLVTPDYLYENCTIAHGDAHVWTLLYPREGVSSTIRLIDWAGWRLGRGINDIAYMVAVHWYPERRARLEVGLLDRYHDGLAAGGVKGYTREQLRYDYRRAVLGCLMIPVWQQSFGIPPAVWWSHLNRLLAAVDDLDCTALLS